MGRFFYRLYYNIANEVIVNTSVPFMSRSRIILNIKASADWRRRPVGIIRVERELTRQLMRLHDDDLLPVYFDEKERTFKGVPPSLFESVMSDDWVLHPDPSHADAIDSTNLASFSPQSGDRFVSVGSDWSFRIPDAVAALYGDSRSLVTACYDLIPLIFPEYTPGPEFRDQFVYHYTAVAKQARAVFAISENSQSDLLEFWSSSHLLSAAPPVEAVPLAGLTADGPLPPLTSSDSVMLEDLSDDGPYIIFVSTLEPRKNHDFLLALWRELYRTKGDDCPRLLFVGMRGWASGDTIARLAKMTAFEAGKVKWIEGISDTLLAHLYSRCMFAVFPSFYEGWGLSATEALAFNKICVVSDSSSLGEATQGLCPAYHPLDFFGWYNEVCRLCEDASYRAQLEHTIQQRFLSRTWDAFGNQFSERILAL